MGGRSFERFAGAAAVVVGLSSVAYGLVFLFLVPADQKGAPPASLVSFAEDPTGRQLAALLLALGGLATAVAAVAVHRRLRPAGEGWAVASLLLGAALGLLTALHALGSLARLLDLSDLYAGGDAATRAAAVVAAQLPSPLDPFSFSKFFLAGLWLLLTGALMARSSWFPRPLAYVALAAGVGVLLLFVGTVTDTAALILATGVPGAAVVGPVFWLWTGAVLWARARDDAT
jgi:Domain of unknown function (DUF4386)